MPILTNNEIRLTKMVNDFFTPLTEKEKKIVKEYLSDVSLTELVHKYKLRNPQAVKQLALRDYVMNRKGIKK